MTQAISDKKFDALLTNDDGVSSPSLAAFRDALIKLGLSVLTVAPSEERSGASHAITLDRPLRIVKSPLFDDAYAVDGTPSDCVYMAKAALLGGRLPKIVVAGVNTGPNLAEDATYSGTVGAAMEAAVNGAPAAAFSCLKRGLPRNLDVVAGICAQITRMLFDSTEKWEDGVFLNVNVPDKADLTLDDVRVSVIGRRRYGQEILKGIDPRGKEFYWIGGAPASGEGSPDSDFVVAAAGKISVTALSLDWSARNRPAFLSNFIKNKVVSE